MCVCVCVCLSTLLNINISETSGPIATKFYLKHHWGGAKAKAAIGFEQDRIGTLVSMSTDRKFLIGSSSYLRVTMTSIISRTSSNFGQIQTRTAELAALERLKKLP